MEIDVVVESPRGSGNKYEIDPVSGAITLDRPLSSALRFPVDYGFVAGTIGEDGDPLDALVLLDEAAFPGCHVRCRPVGLFRMVDEKGDPDRHSEVLGWDDRLASESAIRDARERFENQEP